MKLLPLLILSVMLSISNTVLAGEDKQQKAQNFDQAKMRVLQGVTKRIEILNTFKSCVEKTKARSELKMCRRDNKSAMQALKLENLQSRE